MGMSRKLPTLAHTGGASVRWLRAEKRRVETAGISEDTKIPAAILVYWSTGVELPFSHVNHQNKFYCRICWYAEKLRHLLKLYLVTLLLRCPESLAYK